MDTLTLGKLLLGLGLGLAVLGLVLMGFSRLPILNQFGRLPGDIHIQTEQFSCFAPIVSMLLLSILASIILNLVARVFSK
jgi:hypothetical protein